MANFTVVLMCPHCGNQRSYSVTDNCTQSVTDQFSGGGCGRSFRVQVSRGMVQGVRG
jgi:transcription elongation factor Elf1